jgi:hypothetical protein
MIPVNDAAGLNCGPITAHEMKYTIEKIRSARIIKSPFPHVFIENIYAQRVYSCMLKSMPQEGSEGNGTSLLQTQKNRDLRSSFVQAMIKFWYQVEQRVFRTGNFGSHIRKY